MVNPTCLGHCPMSMEEIVELPIEDEVNIEDNRSERPKRKEGDQEESLRIEDQVRMKGKSISKEEHQDMLQISRALKIK